MGKWFNCQSKHELVVWQSASMSCIVLGELHGLGLLLTLVPWLLSFGWHCLHGKKEANCEEAKMEKMLFRQQVPLLGVGAAQRVPVLRAETQSQRGDVSEVPLLSCCRAGGMSSSLCSVLLWVAARNESEHPGVWCVLAEVSSWAPCIQQCWGFHVALKQDFVLNLIFLQLLRLFDWALLFPLHTSLGYKLSLILG